MIAFFKSQLLGCGLIDSSVVTESTRSVVLENRFDPRPRGRPRGRPPLATEGEEEGASGEWNTPPRPRALDDLPLD